MSAPLDSRVRTLQLPNTREADQKGPDARRRPRAAREAYCLYVERAAAGANEADGPFSAARLARAAAGDPAFRVGPARVEGQARLIEVEHERGVVGGHRLALPRFAIDLDP